MRRGVFAAIFVGLVPGVAAAKPMQKVHVVSEPSGASVYLNDKEHRPECTTPCDVEVPVGTNSLIIELAKYEPELVSVDVTTPKKPYPIKVKLVKSLGTIIVEGAGAANGAKIEVDGEDTGKVAPARLEVEPGSHFVTVTSRTGAKLLDADVVEVALNREVTVTPKSSVATGEQVKRDPLDPQPEQPPEVRKTAPAPRERFVTASVAMDVGFRTFDYNNLHGPNGMPSGQRSHFDEGGQVLLGGQVELYPGVLAGASVVRGLFALFRFQYGVNPQRVSGTGVSADNTTFWQAFEGSLHHRWTLAETATIQIGGGYTLDQYEFNGMPADVDVEPGTSYSAVKIAARGSLLLGGFEPYLAGEVRHVLDGGDLAKRFTRPSAEGVRGAVGIAATFGKLSGRLEGSLTRYSWTFVSDSMDANQASGASDTITSIGLVLGYSY